MKIAIIGTRGIPNNYGGFEQFAEYLAAGLVQRGHEVTVYNSSEHPYKEDKFNGITIKRKWSPESRIGSVANFIYDYLCLRDALREKFDIIYEAGYGTNAISHLLLNINKSRLITNMDGLEWKRAKWNAVTRQMTKYFEKLAVRTSHYLVSDNIGIQKYFHETYNKESFFLAYGANPVAEYDNEVLKHYNLQEYQYYLAIARIEPENNIEMIVEGYLQSNTDIPLLIIGKKNTTFYKYLALRYNNGNLRFIGGVYDKSALDSLRKYALGYFHGHSVGGTNPSLLEAMASEAFIFAHDNSFNRTVLDENALFFDNSADIKSIISNIRESRDKLSTLFIERNLKLINENYSWETIISQHEAVFRWVMETKPNLG